MTRSESADGGARVGEVETHRKGGVGTVERQRVSLREVLGDAERRSPERTPRRRNSALLAIGVLGVCVGVWLGVLAPRLWNPLFSGRSADGSPPRSAPSPTLFGAETATTAPADREGHDVGESAATSSTAARRSTTAIKPLTESEARAALAGVGLNRLTFVPHAIELTPAGDAALGELAAVLKRAPGVPVEFVIHTYTEPTPGQNHGLSVEQGEFVRERLEAMGVDVSTVAATGVGSPDGQSQLRDLVLLDTASLPVRAVDTANLSFDRGTANLQPVAVNSLNALAAALTGDPAAKANLVVYATTGAGGETDHALSHARGDRLVNELAARGIDRNRLSVVGLGATPVALPFDNVVTLQVGEAALLSVAFEAIDRESIDFVPHTTVPTPASLALLDQVAAALVAYPAPKVMIAGHTFTEAGSDANHLLSQRQAEALAAYLASRGVDRRRFSIVGHGDPPQFGVESTGVYVTFTVMEGAGHT